MGKKAMVLRLVIAALIALEAQGAELLKNGGFESLDSWECSNIHCALTSVKHSGSHGLEISGRQHSYEGPAQHIHVTPGHAYHASAWVKLLNNPGNTNGETLELELDFLFNDNTHLYKSAAVHHNTYVGSDWIHLIGDFTAPSKSITSTRFYIKGPEPSTNYVVDDASVTSGGGSQSQQGINATNSVIDKIRKSDIHVQVTLASHINTADVNIHVLQTRKAFPFGTAVAASKYNENVSGGKYRDFIHTHFNWAVLENALKWPHLEPHRGDKHFQDALDTINGLRKHGIKVRGHNLVWSVPNKVQDWIKALSGNELRTVVKQHITETLQKTHGLLEHWDVNNENLHGTWYQDTLHDPDYDLELFNMTHHIDSHVKLFLNDYSVVSGGSTDRYLHQAQRFKAAHVGLYGLGVQCHFYTVPSYQVIKDRLDTLAKAGVPLWVTELTVNSNHDENKGADLFEQTLRALYGHPAVEGILLWGFWDHAQYRPERSSLVRGDNVELTAAGRRVLDLWENQWMTDDTRVLSQTGNQYTVRGFHGDYEVRVIYKGHELTQLKKTFTLGKADHTVTVSVHA
ncbi:hypothetical protein V1264_019621 [Littorina saxatilis]|uniref:GH10 domain-containing protein n=2 Tax=Littorina saxatilis TaxID=31220 RepID=A0AAN9GFK9_9CAEN